MVAMDFSVSKAIYAKNIYNFKWKKMHFYVKIEA